MPTSLGALAVASFGLLAPVEDDLAKIVQYPRGRAAHRGLVRHEPLHTQHLHVRFGCGPCEVECIELGAWATAE